MMWAMKSLMRECQVALCLHVCVCMCKCVCVSGVKMPPQELNLIHHAYSLSMAPQGVFGQNPLLSAARLLTD